MAKAPSREDLVWVVTAGIYLLAAVFAVLAYGEPSDPFNRSFTIEWWGVALIFIIAERLTVELVIRGEGIASSLVEMPIAVCLLLADPLAFVLGRAIGIASALLPRHLGASRPPAIKTVFNIGTVVLAAGMVLVVHRAVMGGATDPAGVRGWLALVIAIQVADILSLLLIALVIKLTQPEVSYIEIARGSVFNAAVTATVAGLGVFLAVATWHRPELLVVDAVALFGVYGLLRVYGTLGNQYRTLGHLYDYSRELTTSSSVLAGATASLVHGASLLGSARGMLFVPWADDRHYWVLRDGTVQHLPIEHDTALAVTELLDGEDAQLVNLSGDQRPGADVLRSAGYQSITIGAVSGHGGMGWLLFDSKLDRQRLKRRRDLITNVASQCATALGRTELVDRLRAEAVRQKHATLHDRLTGLPNRSYFTERLQELVEQRTPGAEVAVLIIDLDRFKEVNDSLGHDYGDLMLKEVADRLRTQLRSSEFLARLGGDEFGVLLHGDEAGTHSIALAERIAELLEEPLHIAGTTIAAGGSIGISLCPRHDEDPSVLMRMADIAMYAAKRDDLRFVMYESETEQVWLRRLQVLGRLRAIDLADQIQVHFQPKVDLRTGEPIGAEALARWMDDELGFVSPAEFIPIAEQSGLIQQLTEVVLHKALPSLTETSARGHDLTLAVNLSGRALLNLDIVSQVSNALQAADVAPERLTVEVTESVFVSDSQRLNDVLLAYEDLGVKISIDDFGTGYSSLAYLRRLPAQELKIDRTFVDGMVDDASKLAIVKSTIALAHELGMSAVAEGIEDVETYALLRSIRCDVGQGYLMAKPMPLEQYLEWLEAPTIPQNFELDRVQLLQQAPPMGSASLRDN